VKALLALFAATRARSTPRRPRPTSTPGSAHGSGLLEDPSLKATVWSFIAAHTR